MCIEDKCEKGERESFLVDCQMCLSLRDAGCHIINDKRHTDNNSCNSEKKEKKGSWLLARENATSCNFEVRSRREHKYEGWRCSSSSDPKYNVDIRNTNGQSGHRAHNEHSEYGVHVKGKPSRIQMISNSPFHCIRDNTLCLGLLTAPIATLFSTIPTPFIFADHHSIQRAFPTHWCEGSTFNIASYTRGLLTDQAAHQRLLFVFCLLSHALCFSVFNSLVPAAHFLTPSIYEICEGLSAGKLDERHSNHDSKCENKAHYLHELVSNVANNEAVLHVCDGVVVVV
mmetsp:Transcript_38623/g.99181  ORF Transcript_38623/g.99181 Transcript_38623/m.99181 type:complete len:285 (+) Transcript_38623:44-898(+)